MILVPHTDRGLVKVQGNLHVWIKNPTSENLEVDLTPVHVPSRLVRVYEAQNPNGDQVGWGFEPLTPAYTVHSNTMILKLKNAPPLDASAEFHHDYMVEDWHLFEYNNMYAILVVLPSDSILKRLEP